MNELEAIQKILAWQTAQVLGYEDEDEAKEHAVLLKVDFDSGRFTPVMIGKNFRNKLISAEREGKWETVVKLILENFVMDEYTLNAAVFFSEDAARRRFSKRRCFDSFDYLSSFQPGSSSQKGCDENLVKWTHCVQLLYEAAPEEATLAAENAGQKHLFSWFWIMEVDAYQKNLNALRFVAHHDQLTGLYNRHMLSEFVHNDTPCIVIMLDVNKFKSINDGYGHAAGDDALRMLARRLESVFYHKQFDLIFRMGGDEFLVIMLDHNEERAIECMKSMREEIQCGDFSFSVSIGYAVNERDLRESMSRADTALYQVKENGRVGFIRA